MKFWREITNDRLSGGVLCALIVLSFAFQIAISGRAAAAMIAPDPETILCSASIDGTHRPAESDQSKRCPCSELCAAGLHLQAGPGPSDATGIPIRFAARIEETVDCAAALAARPIDRRYDARGPPLSLS
ncbi:hypothetical protein [Aureimonas glaciei]|uniref:DUF2946 domain-containing protein n=1 Tax=Aureimonas glaciei TaxID=1776957 RepID=A0A916YB07_9HYPH|nr:hypothetical protein [Aureimonas glaciei]GGD37556.1 hypothetical protein GCM10011335_45410 [Aureimonas glaciei]